MHESDAIGVIRWAHSLENLKYVCGHQCESSLERQALHIRVEHRLQMDASRQVDFLLPLSRQMKQMESRWKACPDCIRGSAFGATLERRCEDRSFETDAGASLVQEDGLEGEGSAKLLIADSCQLRSTCNVFPYLSIY